ncbi:MAG: LysR family transcriptional regulator [bacterium]|jgi:DNA-binding transcriptional LysR family regulator
MNYSLNQLAIFLKIVQTRSITKTAESMHLTQPAVSIQLKNFQSQFNVPLIEIINKKVYITEFGKDIAESAQNIMNEVSVIDNRLTKYNGSLTGTLRMSSVSTGKYVIPYFLTDFLRENQNVDLRLDVSNKATVLDLLEQNQSDFSLVSDLPKHMALQRIELMPNSLYLVGAGNQSWQSDLINKQTIEKLPLIYREEGSATRMAMEKFIEKNRITVKKKIQLTSNEAVKQAVIAGIGFSIMPVIGLKNELENEQLQIIPIKGLPIKTSWNLIWHRKKRLSPVATAFKEYIEQHKKDIIHSNFNWIQGL